MASTLLDVDASADVVVVVVDDDCRSLAADWA